MPETIKKHNFLKKGIRFLKIVSEFVLKCYDGKQNQFCICAIQYASVLEQKHLKILEDCIEPGLNQTTLTIKKKYYFKWQEETSTTVTQKYEFLKKLKRI